MSSSRIERVRRLISSAILCRRRCTAKDVEKCDKEGTWEGLVTRRICFGYTRRTREYAILVRAKECAIFRVMLKGLDSHVQTAASISGTSFICLCDRLRLFVNILQVKKMVVGTLCSTDSIFMLKSRSATSLIDQSRAGKCYQPRTCFQRFRFFLQSRHFESRCSLPQFTERFLSR